MQFLVAEVEKVEGVATAAATLFAEQTIVDIKETEGIIASSDKISQKLADVDAELTKARRKLWPYIKRMSLAAM